MFWKCTGKPLAANVGAESVRPATRPRVLAAVSFDLSGMFALQRADSLANAFGADLHVVYGMGQPNRGRGDDLRSAADRVDDTRKRTQDWCEAVLAHRLQIPVMVDLSDRIEASVAASYVLAPMLIVIGVPTGRASAKTARTTARRILDRTGRPVLVARPLGGSNRIVAATDFTDGRFPVLACGHNVGARLSAPLTLFHDVGAGSTGAAAWRRRQLDELSRRWNTATDAMVVEAGAPTDTILGTARVTSADLIVVGAHTKKGSPLMLPRGTSDRIVDHAERSVLVVPMRTNHAA
jgi:nucleotide-binding universal stress UspA family protein